MYKKFDTIFIDIAQVIHTAFISKVKNSHLEICLFDAELGIIRTEKVSVDQVIGLADGDIPFALSKVLEHNKTTQTFKKGTKVKFYDRKTKVFNSGVIHANFGDYARVLLSGKEAGEMRRVAKVLLSEA
ncbi:hypothetical protein LMH73_026300 [Vibrio splendidus]|nr:hypothetical protein [Vibrio splendidus]MCC4880423.1 hypothetical protein [Vibrio splendidus]